MIRSLIVLLALLVSQPAAAVGPGEQLDDPALEQRARDLSQELRCLVCQNQSIDDSDAPLAKDLRVLVRDRLQAGDTDAQVMDYIVDRYGEFVLLRPRLRAGTVVLWLTPLLVLLAGVVSVFVYIRRRQTASSDGTPPLSEAEQSRLEEIVMSREQERD